VAVCAYLGCDPRALKTREALGAHRFVASFCGELALLRWPLGAPDEAGGATHASL